jgi:hypothetical protein
MLKLPRRRQTVIAAALLASGLTASTSALAAPYSCYTGAIDAQVQMQYAAIDATETLAALFGTFYEAGCVGYRVTPLPVSCHEYTQPYTGEHTFFDPTDAYDDAFRHGSIHVIHDIHEHPAGWSPPGFSEDDIDNLPVDVEYGVLIEDNGFCLRWYYQATGEMPTKGSCRLF